MLLGDGARGECQVDSFDVFGSSLGVHIALGGRDPGVAEEILDEARVGVAGDEATGGVAQGVEAQGPQAGCVASCLEAAAYG